MAEIDHTRLPALKGRLEASQADGNQTEAEGLQREIDALTRETKAHATRTLAERNRLKDAFQVVADRITELRDTPDGDSQVELESLTDRARDLKNRHDATNRELTNIRDSLTRVETPTSGSVRGRAAPPPDRVPAPTRPVPPPPSAPDALSADSGRDRASRAHDVTVSERSEGAAARPNDSRRAARRRARAKAPEQGGAPVSGEPAVIEDMTRVSPRALRTLIIALSVIAVVGAGAFAGLTVLNNRLAETATAQMDSLVEQLGLGEVLSYDSVEVNAFRGRVELRDVEIADPILGSRIEAQTLYAAVPPLEALGLRTMLTGGSAPEQIAVSSVSLGLNYAEMELPDQGTVYAGFVGFTVSGDINPELLVLPPIDQLRALSGLRVRMNDVALAGNANPLDGLPLSYNGPQSDLLSLARVRIDLSHDAEARVVRLDDLLIGAPLLAQTASARILYGVYEWGEPYPRQIDARFATRVVGRESAFRLTDPGGTPLAAMDLPVASVQGDLRVRFVDESSTVDPERVSGSLALEMGPFSARAERGLAGELSEILPFAEGLVTDGTFSFDRVVMDIDAPTLSSIQLEELSYESDITSVTASGSAAVDLFMLAPTELALEGTAVRLPQSVRDALDEFTREYGARIPDSRIFSFDVELGLDGRPDIRIRRGR